MNKYITHLPIEDDLYQRELVLELKSVEQELKNILPTVNQGCAVRGIDGAAKVSFMKLMEQLERLFFLNTENQDHTDFITVVLNKYDSLFRDYVNTTIYSTGLIIHIAPKTHYEEFRGVKHLEVLEKELKYNPNQFLKVFTKNDKLFVFTNKQLTWKQLIKIKILQWTLFESKINDPEPNIKEFLIGMLNRDLNKINTALTNIMTRPDFVELKYKEIVSVLEYGSKTQIRVLEDSIDMVQREIMEYENRLNEKLTDLRNLNISLSAAENAPQEDMQLIIKYLIKHPYIRSFNARNQTELVFYFEAPLIYFDKYILDKIIDNHSDTNRKILNIFINNNYELITRCKIIFDTQHFRVSFSRMGPEPRGIVGHPHIDTYQCFGNHNKAIQDAAKEGNYLGAIEQLSQAVLNINFSDSYVVGTMLNDLRNNMDYFRTWKCKETGAMLTTEEVINNEEASINYD